MSKRLLFHEKNKFWLQFDYDIDVVDDLKEINTRKYHRDLRMWSVEASPILIDDIIEFARRYEFYIPEKTKAIMESIVENSNAMIEKSTAEKSVTEFDFKSKIKPYPFQAAGVEYLLKAKRSFLADDMGLGKTAQALLASFIAEAHPTLIVCPASLRLNWDVEIKKWLGKEKLCLFKIINYDVLEKNIEYLKQFGFKSMILDESHYVKNPSAKRTKACLELSKGIEYIFALSGTPILNRPNELIAQLKILDRLKDFGGWYAFVKRYCGAYKNRFGWDLSGSQNLDELNKRLRSMCYIRRSKDQVLKELPEKTRSIIPVEITNYEDYRMASEDVIAWLEDNGHRTDAAAQAEQLVKIETLKQLSARGKLKSIFEWIRNFLETGQKLVVFAHHREIQEKITQEFNALTISGGDKVDRVEEMKALFQKYENEKIIVCSLKAGGVGHTLTAASNVLFTELGWTPGEHDQAEDRCHRLGQKDNVTAWYLIGKGTIEEDIMKLIEEKRVIFKEAVVGEKQKKGVSVFGDLVKALRQNKT